MPYEMELPTAFLASGILIILSAIWRFREYGAFKQFQENLHHDVWKAREGEKIEGELSRCISHQWVMDNVSNNSHNSFQDRINDYLEDNTLSGFICLALILGASSMVVVLLLVGSIVATGVMIMVFIVGLAVVMGPGNAKTSQELLGFLMEKDLSDLNRQDVVYAKIAFNSVKSWMRISTALGIVFLVISPFGSSIPPLIAQAFSYISWSLFLSPAFALSTVSPALSVGYLALAIILFFYVLLLLTRLVFSLSSGRSSLPTEYP
ncbi:hypothetical protein EU537_10625 [Candidatus Thorarchaeota archaeon]|nr:MAG: hypothetical protein EU537_10625 [Candidatus Thorarchaeota archaeon]